MRKLVWCTDVHLNFLDEAGQREFATTLAQTGADAVLIGGDIAEAPSLEAIMRTLSTELARPIYFVLGNHDYYHGSIAEVRPAMRQLCQDDPWLHWLPAAGVVELSSTAALVGHGGWGDARLGNYDNTPVQLNDFVCIRELLAAASNGLNHTLNQLGDEAASYVREVLEQACASYSELIMLTHVPPFRESCWHEGKLSDDDWLPYFTCHAVGEAIIEVMQSRPACKLTVLCGHTHGAGTAQILPNVIVETGAAEYYEPEIQRVLEVS